MESANNTRNHTLSLVQNVCLTLRPISLSLQIQVIEDTPFEVLLGRPFFTLSSRTYSSPSGNLFGHSLILKQPSHHSGAHHSSVESGNEICSFRNVEG
jgi:hypothetical protein